MSYVLTAYIVDIPKLKSVIGSKDESIVETIIEENPETFEDEEEFDDDVLLSEALRHLIMDEERNSDEAHQYGYALREICGHCGELQGSDAWNGVRWAAVEECGLVELMTKTGPPVELPPNDDGPHIGHLRREQIRDHLQAAQKRAEKAHDSDARSLLKEYSAWLEEAASRNLDLVFFYH
jgi:hypothetical protein